MWKFLFCFILLHKLQVVNSKQKKKATKIERIKNYKTTTTAMTTDASNNCGSQMPMAKYMTL